VARLQASPPCRTGGANPLDAALGRIEARVGQPDPCRLLASLTGHDLTIPEIGSWFRITVALARLDLAIVESDGGPDDLRWSPADGVSRSELRAQREAIGRAFIDQNMLDEGAISPTEAADLIVCGLASCAQRLGLDEPPNGLQAILGYSVHQGVPIAHDHDDLDFIAQEGTP